MLEVRDLHAYYGKSHILHGVHLAIGKGEIVSLLGRNGVGRSTTIRSIMGLVDCTGSVKFNGEEMVGLKAYEVAHKGLGYVPENRDIFPTLTVHQNLLLGCKRGAKDPRWSFDDMYRMFPRLKERQHTEAGVLSGGEQQMLTLCRTLMGDPDLIMIGQRSVDGMAQRPGWMGMRAMREQRLCVFSTDESDTLVRPGPRMAEGARLMARCLAGKAPGSKASKEAAR